MAEVRSVIANVTTGDTTLTTTTEGVAVSSGQLPTEYQTHGVIILGWAQVTTGTGNTALTPRIRRGTAITGTLVGEANALTIGAGETHPVDEIAFEDRSGEGAVEYSLTVQQSNATGNGTILQAAIVVILL